MCWEYKHNEVKALTCFHSFGRYLNLTHHIIPHLIFELGSKHHLMHYWDEESKRLLVANANQHLNNKLVIKASIDNVVPISIPSYKCTHWRCLSQIAQPLLLWHLAKRSPPSSQLLEPFAFWICHSILEWLSRTSNSTSGLDVVIHFNNTSTNPLGRPSSWVLNFILSFKNYNIGSFSRREMSVSL